MKNKDPLISLIIPTRNSGKTLESCLKHIKNQAYKKIEMIVVDGYSTDNTLAICKKYKVKVFQFKDPKLKGKFDATYKRNLGASRAKGEFVYYVDADFELTPNVISEAVEACQKKDFDAVIVKEIVKGKGFWTACKHLEQECYWGDDNIEAPRFFRKNIWNQLRGLDSSLGAGCDDWDLYQRFLKQGFKVTRIKAPLFHNEGKIELISLAKKAFMYGKDATKFIKKNPRGGIRYFFPIRPAYIRNWKLLARNPVHTAGLIVMRLIEYSAGFVGIVANKLKNKQNKSL